MLHNVLIGLGSNLGEPQQQIQHALKALAALPLTTLHKASNLYRSPALTLPNDTAAQPDYVNAVAWLHTLLAPETLLDALFVIEQSQGRERGTVRWQPRTLDLDILLYGELTYHSARLQIPHPEMLRRAFVLYPLHDCHPQAHLPDGRSIQSLLATCPNDELIRISV